MINAVKKLLYKLLGQSTYLKTLHIGFFIFFDLGFLKRDYIYKYHYFVKHLVFKGDYVVDIGANLGYYSKIFSGLVGAEGKVISIEPIKPFYDTIQWALGSKPNCILYNNALGTEETTIEMVVPKTGGYFRPGLAHIATDAAEKTDSFVFNTQVVKGSTLLQDLPKLNYIKCDIEGYEEYVLPELKPILEKHRPMVQIETWGTHKAVVFDLMKELGYVRYSLYKQKLIKDFSGELEYGDFLFIHGDFETEFMIGMKNVGFA